MADESGKSLKPRWNSDGLIVTVRGESAGFVVGCGVFSLLIPPLVMCLWAPSLWIMIGVALLSCVPVVALFSQAVTKTVLYIQPGVVSIRSSWGLIRYRPQRVSLQPEVVIWVTNDIDGYVRGVAIESPSEEQPLLEIPGDAHEEEELQWLVEQLEKARQEEDSAVVKEAPVELVNLLKGTGSER